MKMIRSKLFLAMMLLSVSAHAVTGLSTISGSACSYQNGTNIVSLPNGSTCDITSDGNCRRIGNGYGATLMVPGREGSGNFAQFFGSPPGGVSVASCCTPITCYQDADGDGYGNPSAPTGGCGSCPGGYVTNNTDCCDSSAGTYPGSTPYYSYTNSCGNFDWNCDGNGTTDKSTDMRQGTGGGSSYSHAAFSSPVCNFPTGGAYLYNSSVPGPTAGACGSTFANPCSTSISYSWVGSGGSSCTISTIGKCQQVSSGYVTCR